MERAVTQHGSLTEEVHSWYVIARTTNMRPFRSAHLTALIGGFATAVAFSLARLISK